MKQRLITAGIGLFLFFIILFFFETYLFNIAFALASGLIVHELMLAYKFTKYKLLTVICCVFGTSVPLIITKDGNTYSIIAIIVFVGLLFGIALKDHNKITVKELALPFMISIVFPFALGSIIYIRNQFDLYQALYYTLLVFAFAWGSDSGAYFIGRFFGKRKLSPNISPNKTIEGLIGGVFSCIAFTAVLTLLYNYVMAQQGITVTIHYLVLFIVCILGSLIGVMGDLCASMIKRQCGIKDFGSIMPGHGGFLDRFDSVLFIAPFFFVVLQVVNLVT